MSSYYKRVLQTPDLSRVRAVLAKRVLSAKLNYVEVGRVREGDGEGVFLVQSKSSQSLVHVVELMTQEGPTCTCSTNSLIQCVHILSAALVFPKANEFGLDPSTPRAYPANKPDGDGSGDEEPIDSMKCRIN